MPRILLLHATPLAIEPIRLAFASLWPEAETVHLLDEGLSIDRAREANLSERLIDRFIAFGSYGLSQGADGVLVTCSAFGPAIERLAASVAMPVLRPNEAMFRAAIGTGRRIGMLATFAPAVSTMGAEFAAFASETGTAARLDAVVVEGAMADLRTGNAGRHDDLIAAAASALAQSDAIMLAQFSMARAADKVRARVGVPVLTAPEAAVGRMKALIAGEN